MKRIWGVLIAFCIVIFGSYALTQSSPVPFNIITHGGYVAADAGYIGTLTVIGAATSPSLTSNTISGDAGTFGSILVLGTCIGCGISTPYEGTLIFDAGISASQTIYGPLTVNGTTIANGPFTAVASVLVDGGVTMNGHGGRSGCFGDNSLGTGDVTLSASACDSNGYAPSASAFIYSDDTNVKILSPGSGYVFLDQGESTDVVEVGNINGSTGLAIQGVLNVGNPFGGGSNILNIGVGTCQLGSGTCNAVTKGTTSGSSCSCQINNYPGSYWYVDAGAFACWAIPDAGATTVVVQNAAGTLFPAAAQPYIGVTCFN